MASTDPLVLLQQALAVSGTALLESAAAALDAAYPRQPVTFFARAEIARRRGELMGAAGLSGTALASIFPPGRVTEGNSISISKLVGACLELSPDDLRHRLLYLIQFGQVFEQAGLLTPLSGSIPSLAAPLLDSACNSRLGPHHLMATLAVLGFTENAAAPWAESLFENVLLPSLHESAARGNFETALMAEHLALVSYVRRTESQAWFKSVTARWVPQLAAAARASVASSGPRHALWKPEDVRRIGLLVHQASLLAHIVVAIETLAAVQRLGARSYEFTVFVVGGRDPRMEQRLRDCNARTVYLDEGIPDSGHFERLIGLEKILARDNFAAIFWVSHIAIMAVAFPRRIAPLQGWWAMKYHACDVAEIDVHLAVENVVTRKSMEGVSWRTVGSASAQWFDPAKAASAAAIRSRYAPDAIVAASIGREEKLDSPAFLDAVCELLRRHPKMVFLWTGRVARRSIQSRFEAAGVADRAHFLGWVDTKAYAQAIDLFLDSFPFPCGFTLKEAMAAGKAAVMMRSPESLETGVPGAISPVLEGTGEVPPAAGERLRRTFTATADFDLYFCARDPAQYVQMASALVESEALRARAGAANREFITTFLSSPEDEARKFLDHLDELFETIPTAH